MSTIPSWAVKGAKVVCVAHEAYNGGYDDLPQPAIGVVYTLTRVGHAFGAGYAICSLAEMPVDDDGVELGYDLRCFRPAVEDGKADEVEAKLYRQRRHRANRKVPA